MCVVWKRSAQTVQDTELAGAITYDERAQHGVECLCFVRGELDFTHDMLVADDEAASGCETPRQIIPLERKPPRLLAVRLEPFVGRSFAWIKSLSGDATKVCVLGRKS